MWSFWSCVMFMLAAWGATLLAGTAAFQHGCRRSQLRRSTAWSCTRAGTAAHTRFPTINPSRATSSEDTSVNRLKDLIDAGDLTVVRRRRDYRDRRDDYQEPQELYILGTAHGSPASVEAVQRVIREVRPDNVVVEMCASRSGLCALNTSTIPTNDLNPLSWLSIVLRGRAPDQEQQLALDRSVKLAGGRGALMLQWCLSSSVKQLANILKVQFGEEFRAARAAADEVGAQMVLGDRPIELTMRRAWASMAPEERGAVLLALLGLLLGVTASSLSTSTPSLAGLAGTGVRSDAVAPMAVSSSSPPSPSRPSSFTSRQPLPPSATLGAAAGAAGAAAAPGRPHTVPDMFAAMMAGSERADGRVLESLELLAKLLPGLYDAVVQERDDFLAWAVKRSKAVNGSKRVVAVVGKLHLKGMLHAIHEDNGGNILSFRRVARLPEPTPTRDASSVALSPPHRRLLGQLLWRWTLRHGPKLVRDVVLGTVVVEGVRAAAPLCTTELHRLWEQVMPLLSR